MKMKKLISLLLTVCLIGSALLLPAFAAEEPAVQNVRALGIMVGDRNGNLNLEKNVTRAEFTKMLVAASPMRDSVRLDGTGYMVFSDVPGNHWASDYIRLAAASGWMLGYTDGSFHPNSNITLEEACTAALRLIGYNSSNLKGAFPAVQLNKAQDVGLRSQIALERGQLMTRLDCARLFNNLLTAQTADGRIYAMTLGFTVTNGSVDIASAVQSMLSGPFIAQAGTVLPFTPVTVYRDGITTQSAALAENDVYYYNTRIGALWICTERVSGVLAALSPNAASPTAVTVAGMTYQLSGSAAYRLSSLSNDMLGKTVTLLLGLKDVVVDVLTGSQVDATYYGIVQSCTKSASGTGEADLETTIRVVCTDGVSRTFSVKRDAKYESGKPVVANVSGNGTTVHQLATCSLNDYVSDDAKTFAGYKLAENIEILDTSEGGAAARIAAERIAGFRLREENVLFYSFNENGELNRLILRNVSGDTWTYGFVTGRSIASERTTTSTYTAVVDGKTVTCRTSGNVSAFPVDVGGCAICYSADGTVSDMRRLSSVTLESLGVSTAAAGNKQYSVSDTVQVYLKQDGEYYLTELSSVNTDNFTLTGWYDNFGTVTGGKLRVIIAVRKA